MTLAEVESQRRALRRQLQREREAAARLAGELEAARRIQMGILPQPGRISPARRALDAATRSSSPRATVGGDLYDFFRLERRPALLPGRRRRGQGAAGQPLHGGQQVALQEHRAAPLRATRATMMSEANARDLARQPRGALRHGVRGRPRPRHRASLEYCERGARDAVRRCAPGGAAAAARRRRRPAALRGGRLRVRGRRRISSSRARRSVPDDGRRHRGDERARASCTGARGWRRCCAAARRARRPAAVGEAIRADVARVRGRRRAGGRPGDPRAALERPEARGRDRYLTMISTRRFRGSATWSGGRRRAARACRGRSRSMPLRREPALDEPRAHALGALERQRVVVRRRRRRVGVADDDDSGRRPLRDLGEDVGDHRSRLRRELVAVRAGSRA